MTPSLRLSAPFAFAMPLLLAACGHKEEAAIEEVRPVYSAVVGESAGAVGATYSGVVHARYESKLGFQASGRISQRLVELGQRVKRGQLLMRLDPAQEMLRVASASAESESSRARVAQLKVDIQRTEALLAKGFASQSELDTQKLSLADAEGSWKSATAREQLQRNQRAYTELVADRDGTISAIDAESGQVVMSGQQVVTIAGDGEREVQVSVPESRVEEVRRAKHLQISLWAHPGTVYEGVLREIAPDSDRVSRTYAARITVKDPDARLMLGMTASVVAPEVEGTRAIRLPLTAIYNKSGQPLVWVVDAKSSTVSTRPVKIAGAHNEMVLIADGLVGGETVVTAGVHMLHAGQRVKATAQPPQSVAQGAQ